MDFIYLLKRKYILSSFKYTQEVSKPMRYGWISPKGKRYQCGYENHVFSARELLDSFYPNWKEEHTTHSFITDRLLDKGWVRVTNEHTGAYLLQAQRMNDSIIEFLSDLKPDQECTLDLNKKIHTGTAQHLLEANEVTADVIKPKKFNQIKQHKSKRKTTKTKKIKPKISLAEEKVGFSDLTNTRKLVPFIQKELQLTDPFNFSNETWARFTKAVAPKLLTALLLDMNIVPSSRKAEFARYLDRRLRSLSKT